MKIISVKFTLLVTLTVFHYVFSYSKSETLISDIQTERVELIKFYNSIDGLPWDTTQSVSTWQGVSVNNDGEVIALSLSNLDLQGNLINLDLPHLRVLKLSGNQLSGEIPSFDKLPQLDTLALDNNQFSNIIEDYQLPSLRFLNLSSNSLVGSIPNFSGMPKLEVIGLNRNPLNTTIPDFLSIPELRELYLYQSNMVGIIPDFSNIPKLETLQLGDNQLNGNLPDFSNLPALTSLDIWVNSLSGVFPGLVNCPNIVRIDCSKNQFTQLPEFSYLSNLQELTIDENYFTFEDILPNISIPTFKYADQKPVGNSQSFQKLEGDSFTIELDIDTEVNGAVFQWFKDNNQQPFAEQNTPNLNFSSLDLSNSGMYTCQITHPQAPDLTLITQPITLTVIPEDVEPCAIPQFEHTLSERTVSFYNQSLGVGTYSWTFGDGQQSSQPNPQHEYNSKGIYEVCLTITDDCGDHTFCRELQVFDCDSLVPVYDWAVKIPDEATTLDINENDEIFIGGSGFFSKYSDDGTPLFLRDVNGADILDIALDANGNILLTGNVFESADLDPSEGQFMIEGDNDMFVAKYNSTGDFIWGFILGDENDIFGGDKGRGITADLEGNVYVTGFFDGNIDIDPGEPDQSISSNGNVDIFLAKYSPIGKLIYGFGGGGNEFDIGTDIKVKGGNIFISGNMGSTTGIFSTNGSPVDNPGTGFNNPILLKYTLQGEFISINITSKIPEPANTDHMGTNLSLEVDPLLNTYFGGSHTPPSGDIGLSFSKLDDQNNILFYDFLFTSNPLGRPFGESREVDYDFGGNLYVIGSTTGKGFVEEDLQTFSNSFLGKYNSSGSNDFLFSPIVNGEFSSGNGLGMSVNSKGDIYTLGSFSGTSFDFDPSDNESLFQDNGAYLVKYSQVCAEIACTLSAELGEVTNATCGNNNGAATVNVSDAQGDFTVSWSNNDMGTSITGLTSGEYSFTISDEAGCEVTQSFSILDTDVPVINISDLANAECGEDNGTATATITGGLPPYQISWSNGQAVAGLDELTATNLTGGSYIVTVTDNIGCQDQDTVIIEETDSPDILLKSTDATCNENNGTLIIEILGGAAPFQINWPDGQEEITGNLYNLSNLAPGTYRISVSDDNGCIVTDSLEIGLLDAPELSLSIQNARCGENNGAARVDISGGKAPFDIEWDNGAQGNIIENLSLGPYSVTVNDSNNCEVSSSLVITGTDIPVIETQVENASCGQNDGSAVVTISKGQPEYQILWSNGQKGDTLKAVREGTYSVTVSDANDCKATDTLQILNINGPILSIDAENATCDDDNGIAWLDIEGGTPPFSINWVNNASTDTIFNLAPGNYGVTVIDERGCLENTSINVGLTDGPAIELLITDATCDSSNASVTANVSGGTPPYQIEWSTGQTSSHTNSNEFSESIANLSEGMYGLVIIDQNQCEIDQSFEINSTGVPEVSILSVSNASCDTNDGSATLSVTGGAGNYQIIWDNGQTGQTATGLSAGMHTVKVSDELNCQNELTINIDETEIVPEASFNTFTEGLTVSFNNLSKQAENYSWNFGDGTLSTNANPQHTYSDTGSFEVCLISSNSCASDTTCIILEVQTDSDCNLALSTSSSPSDCQASNGTATVNALPANENYTFWWQTAPAQFSQQASNLAPGRYQVIVYSDVCRDTASVVVGNNGTIPVADFTFEIDSNSVNFSNKSQFGEQYNWDFGNGYLSFSPNPTYNYPEKGIYEVTLEVSNNCGIDTLKKIVDLITTHSLQPISHKEIKIIPNPHTGLFRVSLSQFPTGIGTMSIYDLHGRELLRNTFEIYTAEYTQSIDISSHPAGLYILHINTDGKSYYKRFEIFE